MHGSARSRVWSVYDFIDISETGETYQQTNTFRVRDLRAAQEEVVATRLATHEIMKTL